VTSPIPSGARRVPSASPAAAPDLWRPTPLAALELADIPTELHFVRDHFPAPACDPGSWSLELAGSEQSLVLNLHRLRTLPRRTSRVVLECAGHRRAELKPIPPGVPWATGAVTEAQWTGASLRPLLELVGIPSQAREVVLEGADAGPVDGFHGTHRFARSLPLAKALDDHVLLAYRMNGEPIPSAHGGPVRAIVPGWYATDSIKWLDRIYFTDKEFDGVFQAHDYRLRAHSDPGSGRRMTELPVHALITTPADGESSLAAGAATIRGIAWGGTDGIARVLVRIDLGPWTPARLGPVGGPHARVSWELPCTLAAGVHEIACRAIDGQGIAQPDRPSANVHGYANNAIHRVRFKVA